MTDSGFEASFPVVFFDGEKTTDMGTVFVEPSLNFKAFQSIISKKIGVSPHQITTYFERSPLPLPFPAGKVGGRRTPVTNKFNFAGILRERNCFFFVVSKRSRRARRRRHRQTSTEGASGGGGLMSYPIHGVDFNSPDSFVLLRRNPNLPLSAPNFSYRDHFPLPTPQAVGENWYTGLDHLDYSNQVRRFVEGGNERYQMSLNLNSNVYSDLDLLSRMRSLNLGVSGSEVTSDDGASSSGCVSSTGSGMDRPAVVCDVCTSARIEGQKAPFHSCKYDVVLTTAFRSLAGPIARPAKNRG